MQKINLELTGLNTRRLMLMASTVDNTEKWIKILGNYNTSTYSIHCLPVNLFATEMNKRRKQKNRNTKIPFSIATSLQI